MNQWSKYFAKNNLITQIEINRIDKLYHLSSEALLQRYNEKFISIFKHAFNHSPFYKSLYQSHGIGINDIKDLSDINKLPIINKHLIKHEIDNIYTSFNFLKVTGLTSGTSGSPMTLYRTPFDIATEQAYIRHYRKMHGFNFGQPLLSIRGMLGKSVMHEYFKPANILYISSPNINESTIEMYYDLIQKFKPVAVEAFPSYLHKFCIELENKGLKLDIPVSFTSSETLLSWQREKIEPFLNTRIFDWYGNAERSILLAQNAKMEYYPMPVYSVNEFRETEVITTNLINKSFPIIRYEVDDRITVASTDFLQNQIAPKIINIAGRASENVILKDGSHVGCIDHSFKGVKNLEMAQVHQYNVQDPIEIKIVVTPSFSKADEDQLRANWVRMVGTEMELKFVYCTKSDLTINPNQKYKLIIKQKPD
jgi:phenylacetate-CoA ligase